MSSCYQVLTYIETSVKTSNQLCDEYSKFVLLIIDGQPIFNKEFLKYISYFI